MKLRQIALVLLWEQLSDGKGMVAICCRVGKDSLALEDLHSEELFKYRHWGKMLNGQLGYPVLKSRLTHKGERDGDLVILGKEF